MKKVFSVLDFGARAGLDELQTRAIQRCIDECFLQGGGTVEVPAGDYLTGDLRLRTGVLQRLAAGGIHLVPLPVQFIALEAQRGFGLLHPVLQGGIFSR